ncbi:LPXTG cell wall anchor domain-containing protein [Kribbella qitaiheensis]|uniref:LPXTG cell wall anchor domain-containing protein n=1 Tax=Kribbella qitaiheensis TaxID=1544730 RepID=A0A7G6X6Z7_9ACTN|nr:SCO2322 family protein [Kribbella qitaiheensis]QNE22012.1 LPXTG cell wall anchor domain-containing protein [Kribbella qitaiheensis]
MKKTARLLLSLLVGLALAGTLTTTAQAENGYRFWGYYQWTGGQWAFAQKGSDGIVPADGSVEGWRYAVGGAKPRVPRAAGDFQAICGTTPVEAGKKRVALVIDPGTPADSATGQAPPTANGTCVVAAPTATGAKILAAVGPVRIEKGLTCGIDGYPETTCGQPVNNIQVPATDAPVQLQIEAPVGSSLIPTATPQANSPVATPTKQDDNSGAPWGGIAGFVVLVLLLAGGGFLLSRRRRSQHAGQ